MMTSTEKKARVSRPNYDYLLRAVDAGKWPIRYNGGWLWEPEALQMMERYECVHDIANDRTMAPQ